MPLHIGQKKILLLSYLIVIETWTNLPTAKNCLLTLAKFDAKVKNNPLCLDCKIDQTIPYNRTFNILGCIKYDRPNYDLAIYWGTKNKVIGKPVTNYILMYRTFYVVFFTSYTG